MWAPIFVEQVTDLSDTQHTKAAPHKLIDLMAKHISENTTNSTFIYFDHFKRMHYVGNVFVRVS